MPLFLMRPATETYKITHERKFWTHEIPTRKNFGPTKHPRKKIWDTRNIHERIFWTHEILTKARREDGTRHTRPTMARELRNLAHSFI